MLDTAMKLLTGFRTEVVVDSYHGTLEVTRTAVIRSDTQIGIPGRDGSFAISPDPGNQIESRANGAYVAPADWVIKDW